MVATKAVHASNALVSSSLPASPVAMFIGGTSGIGRSTLEAFAAHTQSPFIIVVGRSKIAGEAILKNLRESINPKGRYELIISPDLSLLAEVDRVCAAVKGLLKGGTNLDFLCLTIGFLAFSRIETKEGLEALMSVRYYARMRFIQQLLPLHPKHVLSVGAGTKERPMIMDDLPLLEPKNYSVMNNAANGTTMTSLSLEHLAKEYPNTAFVHAYPGIVKTPSLYGRDFGSIMRSLLTWIIAPLITPFCTDVGEAGQLGLFYLTSKRYASLEAADGVDLVPGVKKAEGGGAYLVNQTGEIGAGPIMKEYRQNRIGEKVWKHTLDMFEQVERKTSQEMIP